MKSAFISRVLLAATASMLAAQAAQAQNNYSTTFVTISNLVFYSASDSVYPQYAGSAVINFATPLVWRYGNTCATGTVAIRPADKSLMTAVQAAQATGRPVQVFVDDAQTVDGVVCWLRAVEM